jgi:hypothetical protein
MYKKLSGYDNVLHKSTNGVDNGGIVPAIFQQTLLLLVLPPEHLGRTMVALSVPFRPSSDSLRTIFSKYCGAHSHSNDPNVSRLMPSAAVLS